MALLIGIDIDGTLYGPKSAPFNQKATGMFQKRIPGLLKKKSYCLPILTTGKPAAYVEAFAEAWGWTQTEKPAVHVCENGAVLFRYRSWAEREYADTAEKWGLKNRVRALNAFVRSLKKDFPALQIERGKEYSVSCGVDCPEAMDRLYGVAVDRLKKMNRSVLTGEEPLSYQATNRIAEMIGQGEQKKIKKEIRSFPCDFFIFRSKTSIDFLPFPISKAIGLALAASTYGITLESCIAVGDSGTDQMMFSAVDAAGGLAVAVSNATAGVRRFVLSLKNGIVLPESSWRAVVQTLDAAERSETPLEVMERLKKVGGNVRFS